VLLGPGGTKVRERGVEGTMWRVALDVLGGALCGVTGPEVGTVTTDGVIPEFAGVVEACGDEVGDVVLAPSGHPDVRRGTCGVLAEDEVADEGGLALGAVDGGGVGQLDLLAHVRGWEGARTAATVALDGHRAGRVEGGDGPGVAVGDPQFAIVASGRDPVTDAQPLSRTRDDRTTVIDVP
jgi:hypothetical protein